MVQKELNKNLTYCLNKFKLAVENKHLINHPFKHIAIDDDFDEKLANDALEAFDLSNTSQWEVSNDKDIEIKMRSTWKSDLDIPDEILPCVRILNSNNFLEMLSNVLI